MDWNEYFFEIVAVVAKKSTCIRRQVGAIFVKDKRILATGYNGAPKGLAHCDYTGCVRADNNIPSGERHELCRGVHAEQNAIIQAAIHGTNISGSVLYCTCHPCSICAKMLVNAGIPKIVIRGEYADEMAKEIFKRAGVIVKRDKPTVGTEGQDE